MTMYTIVAYRPNSHYSRRQCLMGSSMSDFDLHVCDTFGEAVEVGASYLLKDADRGEEYADWELRLLVDGMDEDAWWKTDAEYVSDTVWDQFARLAKEKCRSLLDERERRKAEEEAATQRERERISAAAEQRLTEERERAELCRLTEKYGAGE